VASLQGGWVGLATALSPATAGHFKFLLHHFFVGLGLTQWAKELKEVSETLTTLL
jgi:hypothetical protein